MGLIVEKNFLSILKRFGHDVLLQRCLNSEEGNQAYIFADKLERWTTYSLLPGGSSGISRIQDEDPEGFSFNVDQIFYFQPEANPTSGDRIYEEVDRLPNKQAVYSIDFAQPLRGLGGKIVFWQVGSTRQEPS